MTSRHLGWICGTFKDPWAIQTYQWQDSIKERIYLDQQEDDPGCVMCGLSSKGKGDPWRHENLGAFRFRCRKMVRLDRRVKLGQPFVPRALPPLASVSQKYERHRVPVLAGIPLLKRHIKTIHLLYHFILFTDQYANLEYHFMFGLERLWMQKFF